MVMIIAMMTVFSVTASATEETVGGQSNQNNIPYVERSWDGSKVVSTQKFADNVRYYAGPYTVGTQSFENRWIAISGEVTLSGILLKGTINLILCDGATLHIPNIPVYQGTTLNIYGQSEGTGTLIVTPTGSNTSGIGGGYYTNCGTINIHGGNITSTINYSKVTGGYDGPTGAAIGGGRNGFGGNITIYGGNVTANGGIYGAAIGGGGNASSQKVNSSAGNIAIYGGTVIANKGTAGVSIGGTGGSLTINGGSVKTDGTNLDAKNSSGASVSLQTITLNDATDGTALTTIMGVDYGIGDVKTLDTNKLYFYLPDGQLPTVLGTNENYYICKGDNLRYHTRHLYTNGECSCGLKEGGTFSIGTAEELMIFAIYANAQANDIDINGVLTADIDMTGITWIPIGSTELYNKFTTSYADRGYTGIFDGNGHVIKNLTVIGSSTEDASFGLFGTLSGTVKNLGIVNFNYTGAGKDSRVGSIVGQMLNDSLVENCYAAVGNINTKVNTNNGVAGGIAGCNYAGTIKNCHQYNYYISAGRHGGIVGDNYGDGNGTSDFTDRPGRIENCYTNYGELYARSATGYATGEAGVSDARIASGEIAYKLNGESENGVWKQTLDMDAYPNFTGGTVYYGYENCMSTEKIYTNTEFSSGSIHNYVDNICSRCGIHSDGMFYIYTADDLVNFKNYVNAGHNSTNAKLMADIDLSGIAWVPIGHYSDTDKTNLVEYKGTFDGNYHVIKNLSVKVTTTHETGLFSRVNNGILKNFGVISATVENTQSIRAGVIAGEIYRSTLTNVFTAGNITITTNHVGTDGITQAGGIAGECSGSTLTNCYTTYGMLTITNNVTANNCYYMAENANSISAGTFKTAAQFASGEIAYKLGNAWGQILSGDNKDEIPVFAIDTNTVYQKSYCDDTFAGGYTNDLSEATLHTSNAYGYCELCQVKFAGASITVGKDLTMNYAVKIMDESILANLENISVRFTMDDRETVIVTEHTLGSCGYVFAFESITPQCMANNIKAELLLGETVIASKDEYSIRANAESLLEKYSDNELLIQFITDMLTYGAAAQNYRDYNIENLANEGITGTPSDVLPTESENVKKLTNAEGVVLGDVQFKSVTVWFDNVNMIGIKLNAYTENTKLVVKVGEDTVGKTYENLTSATFLTDAIHATEFADIYTFELYEGDTLLQTVTYSISSYVYAKMNATENGQPTEMALLAQTLYRYGASAVAYKNAQTLDS